MSSNIFLIVLLALIEIDNPSASQIRKFWIHMFQQLWSSFKQVVKKTIESPLLKTWMLFK